MCHVYMMEYKSKLRNIYREKREMMPMRTVQEKSRQITERLQGFLEMVSYDSLFLYLAFGNEVSLDLLLKRLYRAGKRVYIPRVDNKGKKMDAVLWTPETILEESKFGIREPKTGECIEAVDVAIIPGVAFAADGKRLGFGGGYYDKWLGKKELLKIGVCYDLQITQDIQMDVHDVPMNIVITESSTFFSV